VTQESFETDVTVTSLEPYTLYTVQVEASNFYSDLPTPLLPSNVEYFMTKPGSQYSQLTIPINPFESGGSYSATLNNTKLVHWPLMFTEKRTWWGPCPPRPLLAQSLYCYMMVLCSVVLMWVIKS